MRKLFFIICLLVQSGYSNLAVAASEEAAALYHDFCSVCHGDKGDGRSHAQQGLIPPPKDFTSQESLATLNADLMFNVVKYGKAGTAMVGWESRLSDDQIHTLVDYIREEIMQVSATLESQQRGADIYHGSCSVCHGDTGKGAYWGATSMNPAPRDFSTPGLGETLTRDRMLLSVTGGRPNTAMAGFASQLSTEDIEAVVDFIRSDFMRP